jgi:hypothetical protein
MAELIECALELQEALALLVNLEQHNKGRCALELIQVVEARMGNFMSTLPPS